MGLGNETSFLTHIHVLSLPYTSPNHTLAHIHTRTHARTHTYTHTHIPHHPHHPHHPHPPSMMTGVTLGAMTMSEVMNKCIFFTMSQAWQLGRAVLRAQHTHTNVLDAIKEQQKGIILITGKVSLCREDSSPPLLDLYPGFFLCVVGTRLLSPLLDWEPG